MKYGFWGFVFIMIFVTAAQAETLNVPAQFSSIQAAVDAASDGDTVMVAPGAYYENIEIAKAVNVRGAGRDVTFLGTGSGWPNDAVKIYVDGITFSGFHVNGGILCLGASPVIEHNTVTNTGNYYYGIYAAYGWSTGKASNPVIQNNLIMDCPDGIQLFWSQAVIRNNIIVLNSGFGIYVSWAWPTIENNTIANNGYAGIQNFYYSYATARNNIIANNGRYGILNYYQGHYGSHTYNVIANNAIANFASFQDSLAIEQDPTEIIAEPGFVNSPLWTSGVGYGPFDTDSIGISGGTIYGDHGIGPFERGGFIQLGSDSRPRTITRVDGNIVSFAPSLKVFPLTAGAGTGGLPYRLVNYLGKNRNLDFNWSIQADSPAVNAGDPDPAFNNSDGTRNTIGFSGGPFADWK